MIAVRIPADARAVVAAVSLPSDGG